MKISPKKKGCLNCGRVYASLCREDCEWWKDVPNLWAPEGCMVVEGERRGGRPRPGSSGGRTWRWACPGCGRGWEMESDESGFVEGLLGAPGFCIYCGMEGQIYPDTCLRAWEERR